MTIWALPNKLSVAIPKGGNFELKCSKMRLAAGLCPDPLGSLERCPGPIREEDRFVVRGKGMREA